jgi:hypothetical protein
VVFIAKVYYQRDERLIRNSKIIEDHPVLAEVFDNYPELDDQELKLLSKQVQQFFANIYKKVIFEAIHEWEIDYSKGVEVLDDNKKIKCGRNLWMDMGRCRAVGLGAESLRPVGERWWILGMDAGAARFRGGLCTRRGGVHRRPVRLGGRQAAEERRAVQH